MAKKEILKWRFLFDHPWSELTPREMYVKGHHSGREAMFRSTKHRWTKIQSSIVGDVLKLSRR